MKPKLISLLLVCVMVVSLAACAKDTPGTQPNETTKETDVQTTENVTTEENTTEPAAELALNEDLLSDIGLTYPELVEKRGEKINVIGEEGVEFYLENGYGAYTWGYEDLDYGRELANGESYPIPRDENHNIISECVQLPKAELPCNYILQIKPENLFSNESFPLNVSELQNIEGIENYRSGEDGIATLFRYYSSFIYKGIEVHIYYNNPDIIETDSRVDLRNQAN